MQIRKRMGRNTLVYRGLLCAVWVLASPVLRGDDWPQWLGPQRDGVWRETGVLRKFPAKGPTVRWRIPIGSGFAGPAVVGGRIYVCDRVMESSNTPPEKNPMRAATTGKERVLCLNEADGKILWQHEYECPYVMGYPAGPRATPTVCEGKVYTLGAEGNLLCLETATG